MHFDFDKVYSGKTVLITGHTGFKGSWLSEWLLSRSAQVVGYSDGIPSSPSHFEELELGTRLAADIRADVRSLRDLQRTLDTYQPDFIFHLAAQPIVRRAFDEPYLTLETNVMGNLNVLEAIRRANRDCVVIIVTTDKVYENREWVSAYRESDALGGHDPYSASKACAELIVASYQRSFFQTAIESSGAPKITVASVRGGNVIGGGDWAKDRIVPDCMRHLATGQDIPVRHKTATRPWLHVLELLSGYLLLGAEIYQMRSQTAPQDVSRLHELCSTFNFGPLVTSNQSVETLVQTILTYWPGQWKDLSIPTNKHEAGRLHLAIDKAYHLLGWHPRWTFDETIRYTTDWYREYYATAQQNPPRVQSLTRQHIQAYESV